MKLQLQYTDKALMSQQKSVFEYSGYKAYLINRLGKKRERKGLRSSLAKALGCQPTYISQVLNGSAEFNLEQGHRVSDFLGHSAEEEHYFLLMIQKARAGTKDLERYFDKQIGEIRERRLVLTERLGKRTALSKEHQAIYYSSWLYAAVHIALTIPELRERERLSRYLGVPLKKVNSVLSFLEEAGLIALTEGDRFAPTETQVRLGNDSSQIIKHHSNWRVRALESLDREELSELHYSSVFSIAREDVEKVKNLLLESIKKNAEIVGPSKEEELCALCVDFFFLKRD
jgi:uncharacterized protein (TIGR02147 family)